MRDRLTFTVTYRRDEDGWWIAVVRDVDGVNSDGRTIEEARRRVREALGLAIDERDAERAVLLDDVRLEPRARALVKRAKAARARAARATQEAGETQLRAAAELTRRMGLSLRDAGALLDLSHVAVAKALKSKRRRA